jgi:hypothetical protein
MTTLEGASGGDVPVLNANQRRHVEVVLSKIEDSLARVEALCDPAYRAGGILTVVEDDLPHDAAAHARPIIAEIRETVARLATDHHLDRRRLSRRRTVQALLTSEIIRIDDSSPNQLRGYGAVDPRYTDEVAPRLREIRKGLAALATALRGPAPNHPTPRDEKL